MSPREEIRMSENKIAARNEVAAKLKCETDRGGNVPVIFSTSPGFYGSANTEMAGTNMRAALDRMGQHHVSETPLARAIRTD